MARFWAKFIGDKCWTAIRKPEWSPESEREKAMEEARECLKALESALNGNKLYGGHTIGLVDIAANFTGFWLSIVQEATGRELLSAHKFPLLSNWSHCGIVQECLLPQRQGIGHLQSSYCSTLNKQPMCPSILNKQQTTNQMAPISGVQNS
uniref:GST C-terminal domain-containing protein n=3 Tax=Gossypium raimondii TaxID=29730 RepID=A0A0D2VXY3_GOSRA|nr:hypothetical protein B456_012G108800 [Gossypium raimondii]